LAQTRSLRQNFLNGSDYLWQHRLESKAFVTAYVEDHALRSGRDLFREAAFAWHTWAWARLQSKSLGVQFSLPSIADAQLHGGRELIRPDFDWAGLDYVFGPSFTDTSYVIKVQEAR